MPGNQFVQEITSTALGSPDHVDNHKAVRAGTSGPTCGSIGSTTAAAAGRPGDDAGAALGASGLGAGAGSSGRPTATGSSSSSAAATGSGLGRPAAAAAAR
jgi:hypothetical protein